MDTAEQEARLDTLSNILYPHLNGNGQNAQEIQEAWRQAGLFVQAGGSINALIDFNSPMPLWLALAVAVEHWHWREGIAILREKLKFVLERAKKLGLPEYKRYRNGSTAYYSAVKHGAPLTALLLLEDGLDLSLEKRPTIFEAINHFSVQESTESELQLLKKLIELGERPDLGTRDGRYSPLIMACRKSLVECSRLLIEGGADVNQTDKYGGTAIMHAIDNVLPSDGDLFVRIHEKELTELLLKNGAHLNARTTQNRTFHSMVKSACSPSLQKEILAIVDTYLGKDSPKPVKPASKPDKPLVLLTDDQIRAAGQEFMPFGKQRHIEWILARFRENGVDAFEAGHITAAYNALKFDPSGEGFFVKCPRAEAEKNLKKIIRKKSFPIETDGTTYQFL